MVLFTTGDILKLIGVPSNTFDNWCAKGIIQPVSGGNGTGNQRQWSLMQAVGFVVAQQVRDSEFSCALKFVGATVEAFGNVDEPWLIEQLKQGHRRFIHPQQGRPLLNGDSQCWEYTDVAEAYKRVTAYAAKKTKCLKV